MSNRNTDDDPLDELTVAELMALTDVEYDRRRGATELQLELDRLELDELELDRQNSYRAAELRLAAFGHALERAPRPLTVDLGDAQGDDVDDLRDMIHVVDRWLDTVEQVADRALQYAGLLDE